MIEAYYNDNDSVCAAWLENLVAEGHLPQGEVDSRSIEDVQPKTLQRYWHCHFFAGIGGWPYAFQLSGWPAEREVWSASVPCQPLSGAGKRQGAADSRHLWPAFFRLIAERRPATVFGEQVGGPLGREWLAAVRVDLEALGYVVGAADLAAAGVGAPHIRQRLYWVADASRSGRRSKPGSTRNLSSEDGEEAKLLPGGRSTEGGLDNAGRVRWHSRDDQTPRQFPREDAELGRSEGQKIIGMGDANVEGLQGFGRDVVVRGEPGRFSPISHRSADSTSYWHETEWHACADGTIRPAQPGTCPLAYGVPGRVGQLRAYGNAIVPQVAATFIRAFMDVDANSA